MNQFRQSWDALKEAREGVEVAIIYRQTLPWLPPFCQPTASVGTCSIVLV